MKYNDNGTWKDLIVKGADTLPIGTEVEYNGTSVPSGWIEIGSPNDYSTNEVKVGTWVDGKKIYKKTVLIKTAISMGTNVIPHGVSGISHVIKWEWINQNGVSFPYMNVDASNKVNTLTNINSIDATNITIKAANDTWGTANDWYLTLWYVKDSTLDDLEVDNSTELDIVGPGGTEQ